VVIFPGSGATIKNWLPTRWADVARALRQRDDVDLLLAGGPGERALVSSIADVLDPRPETLVGETTLGQLAAVLAACDLAIGADRGPLHLAAAVGTPTVRLYGPIDINEFGPWPPDESQVALAAGLPCQPCRELVAPPCGAVEAPACLRAITVDAVVAAAGNLLDELDTSGSADPAPGLAPTSVNVPC
jgi:ADP-heptose:LPS heptosyltransferase